MASSSLVSEVWGKLTYKMPNSAGVLESADVKGVRYVIGRAKGCDLQIGLKMISGHHCYLGKEDGKIYLYDTSTNGTTINEQRVVNGQRLEIFDGDKLYLVRKKSSPNHDFHLVFKTSPSNHNDNTSGPSGTEFEPKTKRFKFETVSSSSNEPEIRGEQSDSEEENFVSNRSAQNVIVLDEDSISCEVPKVEVREDVNIKEEANEDEKQVGEEVEKVVSSTSGDNSIEDILKCSLCLEIFHDPVCLQPCMHCYCSGCYGEWRDCSNLCPQCRAPVQLLAKNHMISALTESFLKSNPEKRRSLSEIALLESKSSSLGNFVNNTGNMHPHNCQCEDCANGNSSSYSSNDSSPVLYQTLPQRTCQQCPGNVNASKSTASQPGNSTSTQIADFVCGPSHSHISCSCCFKLMPDRRSEANVQPQTCELCLKIFCHMYWGCTKPDCCGCLNKFSDLKYSKSNLSKLINENIVETRILTDYAQSKGENLQNVIEECLRSLDSGTYKLAVNLKSDSILCYKCGLSNIQTLMYKYRTGIADDDLPDSVTSRPNCYWGLNCRTQKHNINHAQKYNHICNQTRY